MTSYRESGVDLEAADRHVSGISSLVTATWGSGVVGDFGGFAAGVEIPTGYRDPVLMMTTDGVGTKLELARIGGIWEGVGFDLVAMCVDDLAAAGARCIGFVDYMALGELEPGRDRQIVESIASACKEAGCPLLGGETAEHPGVMEREAVDLAGAALGIVERNRLLSPGQVETGDLIVGLASPNLRSNGFSLIRALFADDLDDHLPRLLEPSVIYAPAVLSAVEGRGVHAAAHITGGGMASNLSRSIPGSLGAMVDTTAWQRPVVFDLVASHGVTEEEMFSTFNMGIGFCLVVSPQAVGEVTSRTAFHNPVVIGEIVDRPGVTLT